MKDKYGVWQYIGRNGDRDTTQCKTEWTDLKINGKKNLNIYLTIFINKKKQEKGPKMLKFRLLSHYF